MRASHVAGAVAIALVLVLVLGAIGFAWLREPRVVAPQTGSHDASVPLPKPAPTPPRDASPGSAPPPPASLRDTEIDGELLVDADGHFVPSPRALVLFDYFLAATGEEPLAQLRARIGTAIDQRLRPPASHEAHAFLDQYLAYRAAAARTASDPDLAASADLERRLQWIRELRREHFGAALAATLFGDVERTAAIGIETRRVLGDETLGAAEKSARITALEAQLPESERAARAAASAPSRLLRDEQALRANGGSDADVRALREAAVGAEAAARLEELDRRRAAWNARLAAYRAERDAITSNAQLDPRARDAALEDVRARRFDARERLRVRALDAIELGAPAPAPSPDTP